MSYYNSFFQSIKSSQLDALLHPLQQKIEEYFQKCSHGNFKKWELVINQFPVISPQKIDLDHSAISMGGVPNCTDEQRLLLTELLQQFHPWRKGPFNVFGIHIDTEWRSDWKWDRLKSHIGSLQGKAVLDVGCSNGYHCLRMKGEGAKLVVGIDPTLLYVMQFHAINKYLQYNDVSVLPLGIDDIPRKLECFDTVFSMGVLYHRKDHLEHLRHLYECLVPGGELVLETLVLEGKNNKVLIPQGRYAQMNNVHAIPSVETLISWIEQCGYKDVRCVDVTKTTIKEQRSTEWMQFQSLQDFLDPKDPSKTIEGYPAPIRSIIIASKK